MPLRLNSSAIEPRMFSTSFSFPIFTSDIIEFNNKTGSKATPKIFLTAEKIAENKFLTEAPSATLLTSLPILEVSAGLTLSGSTDPIPRPILPRLKLPMASPVILRPSAA